MKNKYEIFLAFFIPFVLALFLISAGSYLFEGWVINQSQVEQTVHQIKTEYVDKFIKREAKGENITFSYGYGEINPLTVEYLCQLSIFSLFILSAILPLFVIVRNKPIETNRLKLNK